jgi:four helix bundle protein
MEKASYILLKDLEVYQLARNLSKLAWDIYNSLDWQAKKTMGDQFIRAVDSVGANIAEGYGRFHYLDKIKFYYNGRASLSEAGDHWVELLKERRMVIESEYKEFKIIIEKLSLKLNNFISCTYKAKEVRENRN